MKIQNLFLALVLGILFTSCTVLQTPSNQTAQVGVTWDMDVYDFNQIHFMYQNNPQFFWNNQFVNRFGINTFYYNHPFFLRYRRDCFRRNIVYRPYRPYHRINNNRNIRNNRVIRNNGLRITRNGGNTVNRGRSNSTARRNTNTYRRLPQKSVKHGTSNRSYRRNTPNRTYQRSRSTQVRPRSSSTRSSSSTVRRRNNQ